MVECPVFRTSATTSANVFSGVRLESLITNPALNFFTLRTISAWLAIGCEPKMKERPPLRANSIASSGPETDCMIAETNGMFSSIRAFSPLLCLTRGVLSDTLPGWQAFVVKPGISKYSPKVLDTSFK